MADRERKCSRSSKNEANGKGVAKSTADVSWKCVGCSRVFKEEDSKVLECERCDAHYCTKCVKLSDREYDFLSARPDLHWFCVECDSKVVKSIMYDKEIEQRCEIFFEKISARMASFEERIDNKLADMMGQKEVDDARIKDELSKNFQKLSDEFNNVKCEVDKQLCNSNKEIKDMSDRMKELFGGQDKSWNDVVKREVDKSFAAVTVDIQEVQNALIETKTQAAEQRDKDSRRNNVILYKVPESNESNAEGRNKEDIKFCLQLFNNCLHVGLVDEDLLHVFRLGRREGNDVPRPLMVQLASYTRKNLIMESLYKLRQAEQKYKGIIVAQ